MLCYTTIRCDKIRYFTSRRMQGDFMSRRTNVAKRAISKNTFYLFNNLNNDTTIYSDYFWNSINFIILLLKFIVEGMLIDFFNILKFFSSLTYIVNLCRFPS